MYGSRVEVTVCLVVMVPFFYWVLYGPLHCAVAKPPPVTGACRAFYGCLITVEDVVVTVQ
jgi:hypothetical protein